MGVHGVQVIGSITFKLQVVKLTNFSKCENTCWLHEKLWRHQKCQGFPLTTKFISGNKFNTLRNEFPFRKMKEGLALPSVAPEGKTKTRVVVSEETDVSSVWGRRFQQSWPTTQQSIPSHHPTPSPTQGKEPSVQGERARAAVLDIFRIKKPFENLMKAMNLFFLPAKFPEPCTHMHIH